MKRTKVLMIGIAVAAAGAVPAIAQAGSPGSDTTRPKLLSQGPTSTVRRLRRSTTLGEAR